MCLRASLDAGEKQAVLSLNQDSSNCADLDHDKGTH